MSNFKDLVQQCMIKPASALKRICAPLQDKLNISIFGYCSIDREGRYCNISNSPASLEFFYENRLYFSQWYIRDPHLFQSGYTVVPATYDDHYQDITRNTYEIDRMLLILKKTGDCMEHFFFTCKNYNESDCFHLLDQLHLLNQFAGYFKREAAALIDQALVEGYNVREVLGDLFFETSPTVALLSEDLRAKEFLKTISPLTHRELQCLELFKAGHSAQATAALLHLSQRTIEHHFENMKNKLGVSSKWELLEMFPQ